MRDIPLTWPLYILEDQVIECYEPNCQHGDDQRIGLDRRRVRLGDFVDALNDHIEKYRANPVMDLPDPHAVT